MTHISILALIILFLIGAGFITLAYFVIRSLFPNRPPQYSLSDMQPENPGKLLEERYARGEINREQYEQMKEDLAKP